MQGKLDQALEAFQRALVISPGYEPALRYIDLLKGGSGAVFLPPLAVPSASGFLIETPSTLEFEIKTREEKINQFLDSMDSGISQGVTDLALSPALMFAPVAPPAPDITAPPAVTIPTGVSEAAEKNIISPSGVLLDKEEIEIFKFPLEIEQTKSIVIEGKGIERFLSTQPEVLLVERVGPDAISVTGKNFGHTYFHIWDSRGRWTLEFLTVPKRRPGPSYEELLRKEEEEGRNFKLSYSMDWYSYESGRRLDSLDRTSYSYRHYLSLRGPTPYGELDSALSVRALKEDIDLTFFSLGLTEGKLGLFKDFEFRIFDYTPSIYNLALSGRQLRGAMLSSPAIDRKIDYTVFWGREGGGRYGDLSPGLAKNKDSFLTGININYFPVQNQVYGFSILKGWGSDRGDYLKPYGYDLQADWNLGNWGLGYELAYDSEEFAQLFNAVFKAPRLRVSGELRNVSKDYTSMTGMGWRAGELGGLFALNYFPTDKWDISSRLDIFRDRLYPSADNDSRWNTDFELAAGYRLNPLTSLKMDYKFYNDLGRLSQRRTQSFGLGIHRTLEWFRRISTYLTYRHHEYDNFSSPRLDSINDKLILGFSVKVIGDLYYYLSREFNWLQERYTGNSFEPQVMETGINLSSQISDTPFYGSFRLYYRDEQDAASSISYLSGEDYIEGYGELTYTPTPDKQLYGSVRIRNIWAENPDANKRIEVDFNAGMRLNWDSGFRWEPIGSITGYVFKDLNADGLRQEGELPVEGIKLFLGKKETSITDNNGYYEFPPLRAHKAYVSLDMQSLPSGFVLTVPPTQAVMVAHRQPVRIDFGITSRSEIYGIVFEDVDGNAKYTNQDKGIESIVLVLEDGSTAITDDEGRYRFANISPGEHVLRIDLNTLPVDYLPMVSVKKEMTVFEGVSYNYNIPCARDSQP
ncbi:MAG: SdrD B-like domain-containing protein [Candidatus Omnitrophota bacterium]